MDEPLHTARVELHQEQQTMLMSLYLHARDARADRPVLGDEFAAPILAGVHYDVAALRRLRGNQPLIVARAKLIDQHVRRFLDEAPDAVVLHLGCGLDSRVLRIDPPAGVTWIEVDQAPVIELRRQFYTDRDGVVTIAASVTDPSWWTTVPPDRPVLAVAEGLLMYLPPAQVRLLCDLLARQPTQSSALVADTVAPWVRRIAKWQPNMRRASTGFTSATGDLDSAMRQHPRFSSTAGASLVTEAARASSGATAGLIGLFDRLPAGHRAMMLSGYTTN